MKYVLGLSLVLLGFTGCTKKTTPESVLCSFEGVVTTMLAAEITAKLQCANPTAVTASLQAGIRKMDLCKMHDEGKKKKAAAEGKMVAMGAVGDIICAPAISTLSIGLLMQIPPEWGCTGPMNLEQLKADLLSKCLSAI